MFVSFCFHTTYVLCKGFFRFHEVLQLMVEGGAVLQGQMLKEGLCEAWLRRGAPRPNRHFLESLCQELRVYIGATLSGAQAETSSDVGWNSDSVAEVGVYCSALGTNAFDLHHQGGWSHVRSHRVANTWDTWDSMMELQPFPFEPYHFEIWSSSYGMKASRNVGLISTSRIFTTIWFHSKSDFTIGTAAVNLCEILPGAVLAPSRLATSRQGCRNVCFVQVRMGIGRSNHHGPSATLS